MDRSFTFMPVLCLLCSCGLQMPSAKQASLSSVAKESSQQTISRMLFRASRTASGQRSPVFPEWTNAVYLSFDVRGLRNGTKVSVHWHRSGRELARNDFVTTQRTRQLSTELVSDDPLGSGTYQVEVRVNGRPAATTTFRIAGEDQVEPQPRTSTESRVFDLTLDTEACVAEPSSGSQATTFRRGTRTVHLCLGFENLRRGQRLEVQWFRGNTGGDPIAATRYTPTGDGELSALYTEDGGIPSGTYSVVVTLNGREVAQARFVVQR